MYRVELKDDWDSKTFEASYKFLMYRVELKDEFKFSRGS